MEDHLPLICFFYAYVVPLASFKYSFLSNKRGKKKEKSMCCYIEKQEGHLFLCIFQCHVWSLLMSLNGDIFMGFCVLACFCWNF